MTVTGGHRLVFVGGLHRSGTTPLARCLAGHPQVSGFSATGATEDEGQHLQDVYPPASSYGGPGRFALSPHAHLTAASPLASVANAQRLFDRWRPYWDLAKPVLVEKSPPNLLMTGFLQELFPDASFLVIVRHPVVVALSTRKWARGVSLRMLLEHWFRAHDVFVEDAQRLRRLRVVKYEDFVADPQTCLAGVGAFLGLSGAVPAGAVQGGRSRGYELAWQRLAESRSPWRRRRYPALCAAYEARADSYGYSMADLRRVDPFPVG